jgi:hypothetical protein
MSEAIYAELRRRMDRVSWVRPGETEVRKFKTMGRRIVMFDKVSTKQQPWCGQAEYGEELNQVSGMPYKTILEAHWLIYQDEARNPKAEATIENNLIVDAVKEALKAIPADVGFYEKRNTLGNLAYHCFIKGRIFKDPGDIDGQGLVLVPIRILVP